MTDVTFQNRNRAHAVQQLKRYMKTEDIDEADKYLNASFANAAIFIGDQLETIAKSFNNSDIVSLDEREEELNDDGDDD